MKKQILYFLLALGITACNQSRKNSGNQAQITSDNPPKIESGVQTQTKPDDQTQANPLQQSQTNPEQKTQTESSLPKEQKVLATSTIKHNFEKTFNGQIDAKHDIVLKIKSADGKITGTYFYKVSKTEIKVEGNLDTRGNLILTEFNPFGTITGHFTGTMINNNKIAGTWRNANGDLQLPFVVTESN